MSFQELWNCGPCAADLIQPLEDVPKVQREQDHGREYCVLRISV